jgi:hypothetical protein
LSFGGGEGNAIIFELSGAAAQAARLCSASSAAQRRVKATLAARSNLSPNTFNACNWNCT